MGDCSNYKCDNNTWGKKFRCPRCRHSKKYTCTDCGNELPSNRAIRCSTCTGIIRRIQDNDRVKKEIERYKDDPEWRKRKNEASLRSYHKRKQLNKTITEVV